MGRDDSEAASKHATRRGLVHVALGGWGIGPGSGLFIESASGCGSDIDAIGIGRDATLQSRRSRLTELPRPLHRAWQQPHPAGAGRVHLPRSSLHASPSRARSEARSQAISRVATYVADAGSVEWDPPPAPDPALRVRSAASSRSGPSPSGSLPDRPPTAPDRVVWQARHCHRTPRRHGWLAEVIGRNRAHTRRLRSTCARVRIRGRSIQPGWHDPADRRSCQRLRASTLGQVGGVAPSGCDRARPHCQPRGHRARTPLRP